MEPAYQKLIDDVKEYLTIRYNIGKLSILEKLSLIIVLFVAFIIVSLLLFTALMFFSFAIAHALNEYFGSMVPGMSIIGSFYVLLTILIIVFRESLLVNPTIKLLSRILFKDDDEEILEDSNKNIDKK